MLNSVELLFCRVPLEIGRRSFAKTKKTKDGSGGL